MAKATGFMRRQRRAMIEEFQTRKVKVLGDLAAELDAAKRIYKSNIAAIFSHFSRMPNLPARAMPFYSRSSRPNAEQLSLSF